MGEGFFISEEPSTSTSAPNWHQMHYFLFIDHPLARNRTEWGDTGSSWKMVVEQLQIFQNFTKLFFCSGLEF
jgi:hypothetical protein